MSEGYADDRQFVGVDLHRRRGVIARIDGRGQLLECVRIDNSPAALVADAVDLAVLDGAVAHAGHPGILAGVAQARAEAAISRPGGVIVVEDMDHSGIFWYPACPALERHVSLYDQVVRLRGADPEIGPKLPSLFGRVGLRDLHLSHVQPVFVEGEAKRIHQITLENIAPAVVAAGLAAELDGFVQSRGTIVRFPRIFQLWAYRT